MPVTYLLKVSLEKIIGAFGSRSSAPRSPNCNPTSIRALAIISCHQINGLVSPVLLDHWRGLGNAGLLEHL